MVGVTRKLFHDEVTGTPGQTSTFTVSVKTMIRGIWLNNRSTSSVLFSMAVVPSGATRAPKHELLTEMELVGKMPAIDSDVLALEPGDTFHFWASAPNAVNVYVSGMEMA